MELSGVLVVLVFTLLGAVSAQNPAQCGVCRPEECRQPEGCLSGTTLDQCGCCRVCNKALYQHCDHPAIQRENGVHMGTCGENLECRLVEEDDGRAPEALCHCTFDTMLCGTDGRTYSNLCHLSENAVAMGRHIGVQSKHPCPSAPRIVTPPDNNKDVEGASIALVCEADGYPIPTVEWSWTRVDGKTVFLPSDDQHIAVNMRGGPEQNQVTGYLQIYEMSKGHEGDYTCLAQNEHGISNATARVNVIAKHKWKDPKGDNLQKVLRRDQDL